MIIKFSHVYNKMPRDYQHSQLLDVLSIRLEDLSQDFLSYDTTYSDGGEGRRYPLPAKGAYMILLLRTGSGQIWTTIRRQTPAKLDYYRSHIGEVAECVVVE